MAHIRQDQLTVAVVGLGFGAEFVPLYRDHPAVGQVVLCDISADRLAQVGTEFGIARRLTSYDDILADPAIDAVHLVTPMPHHAEQSVAALQAGKHCGCAVPIATEVADVQRVVRAARESSAVYMTMETAVYTREYRAIEALVQSGVFGRIQFLRGAHYSNYENWPSWKWYPPLQYATHAVAPLLKISNSRAQSVRCFGSGWMPKIFSEPYGNPFPVETAILQLADQPHPLAAEITRTIFQTARQELESFDVYGEHAGFEWTRRRGEEGTLFRLNPDGPLAGRHPAVTAEPLQAEDRIETLPAELHRYLRPSLDHQGRRHGGGHGGSHPHLVHEFISSIVEDRSPALDVLTAADWTLPGICAHESALQDGADIVVPDARQW